MKKMFTYALLSCILFSCTKKSAPAEIQLKDVAAIDTITAKPFSYLGDFKINFYVRMTVNNYKVAKITFTRTIGDKVVSEHAPEPNGAASTYVFVDDFGVGGAAALPLTYKLTFTLTTGEQLYYWYDLKY